MTNESAVMPKFREWVRNQIARAGGEAPET
jgi:hypothetical protein